MPEKTITTEIGVFDPTDYYDRRGFGLEFYHVSTGTTVSFKAYLTSFSESFVSNWDTDDVYGRNDPIETFQNTKRKIALGWAIPANSVENAKTNLMNISKLVRMLYPSYAAANGNALGLSKAPLMKLKFANLIHDGNSLSVSGDAKSSGLLGHTGGFTWSPDLEAGFFDPADNIGSMLYPKVINISCEFIVLHQHSLGWSDGEWIGGGSFPYGLEGDVVKTATDDINASGDTGITAEDSEADMNSVLGSTA